MVGHLCRFVSNWKTESNSTVTVSDCKTVAMLDLQNSDELYLVGVGHEKEVASAGKWSSHTAYQCKLSRLTRQLLNMVMVAPQRVPLRPCGKGRKQ